MNTIKATELKNRLGEALRWASYAPVAVERHGKVVAYLVPAETALPNPAAASRAKRSSRPWRRREEERVIKLVASGDFRPSRWRRAGNARDMAGVAAMLASTRDFDRRRMLALAESLYPGMSSGEEFERWLAEGKVDPARFLPMLQEQLS